MPKRPSTSSTISTPSLGRGAPSSCVALLEPVVVAAVETARAARRAWTAVGEGRRQVAQAKREGGYWLQALEERLNAQERQAAEATIEAHLRAEEAEGVARAVHLARGGEVWTPRNVAAEMDALLRELQAPKSAPFANRRCRTSRCR